MDVQGEQERGEVAQEGHVTDTPFLVLNPYREPQRLKVVPMSGQCLILLLKNWDRLRVLHGIPQGSVFCGWQIEGTGLLSTLWIIVQHSSFTPVAPGMAIDAMSVDFVAI